MTIPAPNTPQGLLIGVIPGEGIRNLKFEPHPNRPERLRIMHAGHGYAPGKFNSGAWVWADYQEGDDLGLVPYPARQPPRATERITHRILAPDEVLPTLRGQREQMLARRVGCQDADCWCRVLLGPV